MLRVLLDCKVNASFDWHLQVIHAVLFTVVSSLPWPFLAGWISGTTSSMWIKLIVTHHKTSSAVTGQGDLKLCWLPVQFCRKMRLQCTSQQHGHYKPAAAQLMKPNCTSTSFTKEGVFNVLLVYLKSWSALSFCHFFFPYIYNCVSVELIQLFTSWIWELIASYRVLIKAFVTEDKLSVPALSKVWSKERRSQKNSSFLYMGPKPAGSTQPRYAIIQTPGQGNRSVALEKWSRCCTKDLALCWSSEIILGGKSLWQVFRESIRFIASRLITPDKGKGFNKLLHHESLPEESCLADNNTGVIVFVWNAVSWNRELETENKGSTTATCSFLLVRLLSFLESKFHKSPVNTLEDTLFPSHAVLTF